MCKIERKKGVTRKHIICHTIAVLLEKDFGTFAWSQLTNIKRFQPNGIFGLLISKINFQPSQLWCDTADYCRACIFQRKTNEYIEQKHDLFPANNTHTRWQRKKLKKNKRTSCLRFVISFEFLLTSHRTRFLLLLVDPNTQFHMKMAFGFLFFDI